MYYLAEVSVKHNGGRWSLVVELKVLFKKKTDLCLWFAAGRDISRAGGAAIATQVRLNMEIKILLPS